MSTVREIATRVLKYQEQIGDIEVLAAHVLASAPAATPPAHVYTSTACQHGLHDRCRQNCKFCGTPCLCACGHVDTSAEFRITPEEAIEYATDEEIGEIPRPNMPPAQEHPDTETRAEMLDRIADEESEALMPGGFNE